MLRQQLSVSCSNNRKITHLWPFIKRHILCWFTGVGLLRCNLFFTSWPEKEKNRIFVFLFFLVCFIIFFYWSGPLCERKKKILSLPGREFCFFSLCARTRFIFFLCPHANRFFLCPEVFFFRALLVQHLASHASNGGEIWWGHHGTNVSMVWITIYIYIPMYIYIIYIHMYLYAHMYLYICRQSTVRTSGYFTRETDVFFPIEFVGILNPPTPLWRWRRAYWGANSHTKCSITFVNIAVAAISGDWHDCKWPFPVKRPLAAICGHSNGCKWLQVAAKAG